MGTHSGLIMAIHVAIVRRPYDKLLLDGRKRIEARLTKNHCPPFGCIAPGERVFLKRSAGGFFASAEVAGVLMLDQLTPGRIEQIAQRYNRLIGGTEAYWQGKREARFATLIWLRQVRPDDRRPDYKPQNMRAWYTLDDAAVPAGQLAAATGERFEVKLTAGAIRQGYVPVRSCREHLPRWAMGGRRADSHAQPIVLNLADGPVVETDIVAERGMFRWRGWRRWFARQKLTEQDRLRFTPTGAGEFLVEPVHA
jgi:hypothetical protein